MSRDNRKSRTLAVALAASAGASIGCGEGSLAIESVRVLDASGTRTVDSGAEHIEASYTLEVTAAADNGDAMDTVALHPSIGTTDDAQQPSVGPAFVGRAEPTTPLRLDPGEVGSIRVFLTGDGPTGVPAWLACTSPFSTVATSRLTVGGGLVFDGAVTPVAYSTSIALTGDVEPVSVEPPTIDIPVAFAAGVGAAGRDLMTGRVAIDAAGSVLVAGTTEGGPDPHGEVLSPPAFVLALAPDGSRRYLRALPVAVNVAAGGPASFFATNLAGTLDFGAGPLTGAATDIVLGRLDEAGQVLWTSVFGDAAEQSLAAIAADEGGAALLAGTDHGATDFGGGPRMGSPGSGFVARIGADGEHLFSVRLEGATPTALAARPDGGAVVAGITNFDTDLGGQLLPANSVFLIELDAAGNYRWSTGGAPLAQSAVPRSISLEGSGDGVLVFPQLIERFDASGTSLWMSAVASGSTGTLDIGAATFLDDGSVLVAATTTGFPDTPIPPNVIQTGGAVISVMARLGADGVPVWSAGLHCAESSGIPPALARRANAYDGVVYAGTFLGFAAVDPQPQFAGGTDVLILGLSP